MGNGMDDRRTKLGLELYEIMRTAQGDRDRSWIAQAACRGMGPERWFPEQGKNATEAKAICAGCEVVQECGDYGRREKYGVWGGRSEDERSRLRRHDRYMEGRR